MSRGRPVKSQIRQNIVEILYFQKKGYGYDIFKIYKEVFSKCAQKSIYYHLAKGVQTKEFEIAEIKKEKGNYSWGEVVEKIYYKLGPNAKPMLEPKVKAYFDKKKK